MQGDLVEIAKKVQQYRFKAASKRGERKLPKIRMEYVWAVASVDGVCVGCVCCGKGRVGDCRDRALLFTIVCVCRLQEVRVVGTPNGDPCRCGRCRV
jgi:hypothetical protein